MSVRDWKQMRLWEIQPIRDGLTVVAVLGLVYLGYVLSVVTVPILLALLLAYLFEPLVSYVTSKRWTSRPFAAVSIIVVTAVLVVVPLTIGTGVAIVQGWSLVRDTTINVRKVLASAAKPEDDAALQKIPEESGWRALRDFLVKQQQRAAEKAAERDRESQAAPAETSRPSGPDAGTAPAIKSGAGDAKSEPVGTNPETRSNEAAGDARQSEMTSDSPADEGPGRPAGASQFKPLPIFSLDFDLSDLVVWLRSNADVISSRIFSTSVDAVSFGVGLGSSIVAIGFTGFLTMFFFYFFCTGWGKVLAFWESLIPERRKGRVVDLVRQMDAVIAGFVRGRLLICVILAAFLTIAYWLIGVPAPLILGPLIGALFIVPYVHGIGVPIAIVTMWLNPSSLEWQQEWWWIVFAPTGVYLCCQFLDDWVLSPTIQGKSTGMDTPTILFASMAGGVLGGIYGLLLAIPVAACIKILLKEIVWPRIGAWARGEARDPLPIEQASE